MEYVRERRSKEISLLVLVSLTAIIANLPVGVLRAVGLEPRYLIALLGIVVIIALFLYLRFFFFLLYALLAVGANLPSQWADALGISKVPLLISLVAMVGFSLLNYTVKLMPSGLEPTPRSKSPEGIKALIHAIDRNNLAYATQVLEMGFDPNDLGENGHSPLMCAAIKGNAAIVELLLRHRADTNQVGQDGLTAIELAYKHGHTAVAENIKAARAAAAGSADLDSPSTVMG